MFGGPQPTHVSFSVNDSTVAKVADNGLINSAKLGFSLVTGKVSRGTQSVTEVFPCSLIRSVDEYVLSDSVCFEAAQN